MDELVGTGRRKYIYEVRYHLPSLFELDHQLDIETALRKPIRSGILGVLRVSCIREYDPICIHALCVVETEWGTYSCHVLLFDQEGYIRFT
jgi:hypothetical protein